MDTVEVRASPLICIFQISRIEMKPKNHIIMKKNVQGDEPELQGAALNPYMEGLKT